MLPRSYGGGDDVADIEMVDLGCLYEKDLLMGEVKGMP